MVGACQSVLYAKICRSIRWASPTKEDRDGLTEARSVQTLNDYAEKTGRPLSSGCTKLTLKLPYSRKDYDLKGRRRSIVLKGTPLGTCESYCWLVEDMLQNSYSLTSFRLTDIESIILSVDSYKHFIKLHNILSFIFSSRSSVF